MPNQGHQIDCFWDGQIHEILMKLNIMKEETSITQEKINNTNRILADLENKVDQFFIKRESRGNIENKPHEFRKPEN